MIESGLNAEFGDEGPEVIKEVGLGHAAGQVAQVRLQGHSACSRGKAKVQTSDRYGREPLGLGSIWNKAQQKQRSGMVYLAGLLKQH